MGGTGINSIYKTGSRNCTFSLQTIDHRKVKMELHMCKICT